MNGEGFGWAVEERDEGLEMLRMRVASVLSGTLRKALSNEVLSQLSSPTVYQGQKVMTELNNIACPHSLTCYLVIVLEPFGK